MPNIVIFDFAKQNDRWSDDSQALKPVTGLYGVNNGPYLLLPVEGADVTNQSAIESAINPNIEHAALMKIDDPSQNQRNSTRQAHAKHINIPNAATISKMKTAFALATLFASASAFAPSAKVAFDSKFIECEKMGFIFDGACVW